MSKLLIELDPEESMNDWLDEIQWKRAHDCVAFENAIEECRVLARQEVEAERERCLEIVELVCLCRYVKAAHSRALAAAARGKGLPDLSDAHLDRLLDASALAEEIAKRIRGEG